MPIRYMAGVVNVFARIISALVFAGGAWACAQPDSELQQRIVDAVSDGDGTVIRMSDLAEFEWDRFHVFTPYTSYAEIDRRLGFHWADAKSTGIHQLDSFNLLVFTQNSEVTGYVELPRNHGDFFRIKREEGFSRETATFVVRLETIGEPWLVLHEIKIQ
jgi:hypothetical protein